MKKTSPSLQAAPTRGNETKRQMPSLQLHRRDIFQRAGTAVLLRLYDAIHERRPDDWRLECGALRLLSERFGQPELARLTDRLELIDRTEEIHAAEEAFEAICLEFGLAEARLGA